MLSTLPGLLVTLLLAADAGDWPQWRGPQRDGIAAESALPATLPDSLQKVWQIEVGVGHSSPVVVGDRVFVHSREGENEVVRALELATGRELWRHTDATAYTMNPAAIPHGKGPKSTPVVASGTLCTLGIAGRLSCFEAASGKVLWQRVPSAPLEETAPDFGTAMSPAILDGRLIAHVGGVRNGALTAFELATGEELWRWDSEGPGYASPVLLTFDGVPQIVTQTREHVLAVDPATGKELWKVGLKTPYVQNIVTPIAHGDLLIVSGLDNPVKALRPRRGQSGAWTAEEVWSNAEVDMYMSSPVLAAGKLVGFTGKRAGQIFALDPATGKTLWLGEGRQGDNGAFIVAGDRLLVLNVAGNLLVGAVGAQPWKPEKTYEVAESATWAHPALLGNRLLVKDKTKLTLWAFDQGAGASDGR